MRAPRTSVPLAVLSIAALAMLFGRAGGSDGEAPSAVVEPVAREPVAQREANALAAVERPRRAEEPVVDLFQGRSWMPAPAPAAPRVIAPAPPPAPTAPALPFTFVGRVQAPEEKAVVWLARGERMLSASEGDVLDEVYRVEAIADDEVVFTFVPLSHKQVLRIDGGGP